MTQLFQSAICKTEHHWPVIVRINQLCNWRLHLSDTKPDLFHCISHHLTPHQPLATSATSSPQQTINKLWLIHCLSINSSLHVVTMVYFPSSQVCKETHETRLWEIHSSLVWAAFVWLSNLLWSPHDVGSAKTNSKKTNKSIVAQLWNKSKQKAAFHDNDLPAMLSYKRHWFTCSADL